MLKNKYIDLIEQTFYFPRHGFEVNKDSGVLSFHGINLVELLEQFGTPLKFTYLPKIDSQIAKARDCFSKAIEKHNYGATYKYLYCTKSSHFSFVINRVLQNGVELETSSAFDLDLISRLHQQGKYASKNLIVCNGFKTAAYVQKIVNLSNQGFQNIIPVLDNPDELDLFDHHAPQHLQLGIRIATEEEPNSLVYTSRLGMSSKRIVESYQNRIRDNKQYDLRMLHFFVNTGIRDTTYFWSELTRLVNVYCDVKEVCDTLNTLDIGGGMPIYTSLGVEYDYEYMIEQIVFYIKTICESRNVPVPHIITEFGSFTVGESGGMLYSIIGQKQQNDKELWYMIDSSFITTLPDTWGIGQKFILLAINQWDKEFQRINLGGITCDSQDFYNSDTNTNQVFMPKVKAGEKLYMGFFHTGAYQESLGGYGGIQHCLIPAPRHVIIDRDKQGKLTYEVFAEQQNADSMMHILGY
jgi:arginine decarboxylase